MLEMPEAYTRVRRFYSVRFEYVFAEISLALGLEIPPCLKRGQCQQWIENKTYYTLQVVQPFKEIYALGMIPRPSLRSG